MYCCARRHPERNLNSTFVLQNGRTFSSLYVDAGVDSWIYFSIDWFSSCVSTNGLYIIYPPIFLRTTPNHLSVGPSQ